MYIGKQKEYQWPIFDFKVDQGTCRSRNIVAKLH